MMVNHYAVLNLANFSNISEVKKRFRVLALKYHPDRCNLPNAAQIFIEINEAYRILSNENSKKAFDEVLSNHLNNKVKISSIYQKEYEKYQNDARDFAYQNSKLSFQKFKEKMIDNLFIVYDSVIIIAKVLFYIALIGCIIWFYTL